MTFWTQLMYCFNGRIAQPLEHTTTLGGEKSTSRCQTFPLMWTFGEDHLVIPRVTFIYWTTALPFGTINININSWMIRLIKIKKGMSNRVKIKIFPRSIYTFMEKHKIFINKMVFWYHQEIIFLGNWIALGRFDFAFPKSSHRQESLALWC